MQRNKYLDDLGIDIKDYGTNFINNFFDKRQMRWWNQRKKYGFDARETYNLDYIFVQWLYSHLMMYKEKAGEVVDLECGKLTWHDKEITQLEAIDILIDVSKDFLLADDKYINDVISFEEKEEIYTRFYEAMTLWGMILPCMWW